MRILSRKVGKMDSNAKESQSQGLEDIDTNEKDLNDDVKMVKDKMEQLGVQTFTIEGELEKLKTTVAKAVTHRVLGAALDEVMRINRNLIAEKDDNAQSDLLEVSSNEFREKLKKMERDLAKFQTDQNQLAANCVKGLQDVQEALVMTSTNCFSRLQDFGKSMEKCREELTTLKSDQGELATSTSSCLTGLQEIDDKISGNFKDEISLMVKGIANTILKPKADRLFALVETRIDEELRRAREMMLEVWQQGPHEMLDDDFDGADTWESG